MAHDVFISYKSEEMDIALSIRKMLEANGISSWMASESIPPSKSYPGEIINAIKNASIVVIILSERAQDSFYIETETDYAIKFKKTVIPFHIDRSEMNDTFGFFLSRKQRIEAYGRMDEAYRELLDAVKIILGKNDAAFIQHEKAVQPPEEKIVPNGSSSVDDAADNEITDPGYIILPSIRREQRAGMHFYGMFYIQNSAQMYTDIIYTMNLTHNKWEELSAAFKTFISAASENISADEISVTLESSFGSYPRAPLNHFDSRSCVRFGVTLPDYSDHHGYCLIDLDIKINHISMTFLKNNKELSAHYSEPGITKEALFMEAGKLIDCCMPGKKLLPGSLHKIKSAIPGTLIWQFDIITE